MCVFPGQVVIQTIPTMVPATAENGDKITVQLAKIITIPAHQLAQCQLQTAAGREPSVAAPPGGLSLLGGPLTVRALAPVSVASGTQVMRLAVPTATAPQPQTLVVSQPGSGGAGGIVTVTTANQTAATQPHIISGIINGAEVVVGGGGLKAAGVQVQTLQLPLKLQQNPGNPKSVQPEADKLITADAIKTEEPEC